MMIRKSNRGSKAELDSHTQPCLRSSAVTLPPSLMRFCIYSFCLITFSSLLLCAVLRLSQSPLSSARVLSSRAWTLLLQTGHVGRRGLVFNHCSTHPAWYVCKHGRVSSSSPVAYAERHTVQLSASTAVSPSETACRGMAFRVLDKRVRAPAPACDNSASMPSMSSRSMTKMSSSSSSSSSLDDNDDGGLYRATELEK